MYPHSTHKIVRVLALLGLLLTSPLRSRANEPSLEVVWGYAKTFVSAVNGFIGTTTITPHCALHYWRQVWWGTYRTSVWRHDYSVQRSVVTGVYVFSTFELNADTISGESNVVQHHDPFALNNLAKWNYRCDLSSVNEDGTVVPFVYNGVETFSLAVWAGRVVKTGYFPPRGPYETWIKQRRDEISPNCNASAGRTFLSMYSTSINDTGTVTVSPQWVNWEYSWPPLLWCGGPFEH
jgi:hypothetical protein